MRNKLLLLAGIALSGCSMGGHQGADNMRYAQNSGAYYGAGGCGAAVQQPVYRAPCSAPVVSPCAMRSYQPTPCSAAQNVPSLRSFSPAGYGPAGYGPAGYGPAGYGPAGYGPAGIGPSGLASVGGSGFPFGPALLGGAALGGAALYHFTNNGKPNNQGVPGVPHQGSPTTHTPHILPGGPQVVPTTGTPQVITGGPQIGGPRPTTGTPQVFPGGPLIGMPIPTTGTPQVITGGPQIGMPIPTTGMPQIITGGPQIGAPRPTLNMFPAGNGVRPLSGSNLTGAGANLTGVYGNVGAVNYEAGDKNSGLQGRLGHTGLGFLGAEIEASSAVTKNDEMLDFKEGMAEADLVGVDLGTKSSMAGFAVSRVAIAPNVKLLGRVGYHSTKRKYADYMLAGEDTDTTDGSDKELTSTTTESVIRPVTTASTLTSASTLSSAIVRPGTTGSTAGTTGSSTDTRGVTATSTSGTSAGDTRSGSASDTITESLSTEGSALSALNESQNLSPTQTYTKTQKGVAFGAGIEADITPFDAIRADVTAYDMGDKFDKSVSVGYLRRF